MKKLIYILSVFAASFVLFSCTTIKNINEDYSAAQIIQMGQNAVDSGNYKSAIVCYETAIERYGDVPAVYAEAKYELGHVYLKQKKYTKARLTFQELLSLYDYDSVNVLPKAYKKLANIGLSKIPEGK